MAYAGATASPIPLIIDGDRPWNSGRSSSSKPLGRAVRGRLPRGVEITQAADELGFRNMWLAEHHFSTYGYLSRPLTFALHLANKTKRHPGRHRRDRAAAPSSAGGRRGDRDRRPAERRPARRRAGAGLPELRVRAARAELNESRARWEEEVDVILLALEGKPFSYEGKYYQIPETTVFPQPVQKPHPPIWVTAQSPDRSRRPSGAASTSSPAAPACRSSGSASSARRSTSICDVQPKHPISVGTQRFVYVTDNEADARAAAEQARWNMRVTLSLRNDY